MWATSTISEMRAYMEAVLGSGVFVLLLWCYFWARYFWSRYEASQEVGSKTLEETLDGSDNLTIASMQRLRKLRQTQKGRMRPAFKQLAGRIAALDLRPGLMRSVSSTGDLFNSPSAPGAIATSPRTRNLDLTLANRRWGKIEQPMAVRELPDVIGRVEETLASALPVAVRDAALFRSICDVAEQRQLTINGPPLEVCTRGHPPALSVVIVLEGTIEVTTDEVPVNGGGMSRYSTGQSVTSLLTTLCAVLGQPAPLPVRLRPVGGDSARLLVLSTAAFAPLVQCHDVYLSQIVRKTLQRLDTGLLEVTAHLGLGPSLLQPAQTTRSDWQVEHASAVSTQMVDLARTATSDSLGVPLSELPKIDVLVDGWENSTTISTVSHRESLRLGRAKPGFARLSPGSLLVVIGGELELHPRTLPPKEAYERTAIDAVLSPASSSSSVTETLQREEAAQKDRQERFRELGRVAFIARQGDVVGLPETLSAESADHSRLFRPRPGGDPCWIVEVPAEVVARCIFNSPLKTARLLCTARHDSIVGTLAPLGWTLDYALRYHSVRAHTTVLERGQSVDGLHVVMSGRLRGVSDHAEYMRGSLIGMAELLDQGQIGSTVKAVRDSVLAQLPAALCQDVAARHPEVMVHICRVMAQRLQAQLHGAAAAQSTAAAVTPESTSFTQEGLDGIRTIAVLPAGEGLYQDELDLFCSTLATAIGAIRSCRVVDSHSLKIDLPLDLSVHHGEAALVSWLAEQEETASVIVYQADLSNTSWSRRCVRQADLVLRLANPSSVQAFSPETPMEIALLSESIARQELVLLHIDPGKSYRPSHTRSWLSARTKVKGHHHVRLHTTDCHELSPVGKRARIRGTVQWDRYDLRSDFHRLARHVCKCSVGLVLGGGGARGLSHLSTIRALEEQGIPIDKVGGTSIGSFVGAIYADRQDWKSTQYRSAAISSVLGSTVGYIKDLTCPLVSFFTGRGMNTGLQEIFGKDTRIEDLWLPFYCISANVASYREVVHRQGVLWRYVRASMSLQGYLPPLCETDERGNVSLLLDGGYLNNLPSDHMRATGASCVIAVDVGGWTSVTW